MTPVTLLSLACAIANQGNVDTSAIEAQIKGEDRVVVKAIIASGVCLPENMEVLLRNTRNRIDSGKLEVQGADFRGAPSEICG